MQRSLVFLLTAALAGLVCGVLRLAAVLVLDPALVGAPLEVLAQRELDVGASLVQPAGVRVARVVGEDAAHHVFYVDVAW